MARMPGTEWLGEHGSLLMTAHDILCIHTIVGYAPAHAAHWSNPAAGPLKQSRDTKYRSAANLDGNHRVLAVENEDHGPAFGPWSGSNVPGFTESQKWRLVELILWNHATYNIPIELVPDSKPGRRGIAYHRQGCNGNFGGMAYGGRVAGGELWSKAFGKVCPGDLRIWQLINEIIPWARQLAGLEQNHSMDPNNEHDKALMFRVYDVHRLLVTGERRGDQLNRDLATVASAANTAGAKADAVGSKVDALTAEVSQIRADGVNVTIDYEVLADIVAQRLGATLAKVVNDDAARRLAD